MNSRTTRRGSSAPTISDVASAAGVSLMTVSRVINNESNVRPATRKKVEAAIAQLNYAPNPAARSLADEAERLAAAIQQFRLSDGHHAERVAPRRLRAA